MYVITNNLKHKAMKKITTLTEVREYLTSIPEINSGGCGISALAMYKWLEKNNQLKSDTKIAFLHYPQWMLECCKNMQIEKGELNEEPHGANHVGIYHDGKYFDCRFDFTQDCYDLIHETNNIDFVKRSLNNVSEWNGSFNRNKYVPEIESNLMINLGVSYKKCTGFDGCTNISKDMVDFCISTAYLPL